MSKRNLATLLWFLAGWSSGDILVVIGVLPPVLSVFVGVVVAGVVRWDPFHKLWAPGATDRRRVRPVAEVAAELERTAQRQAHGEAEPLSR